MMPVRDLLLGLMLLGVWSPAAVAADDNCAAPTGSVHPLLGKRKAFEAMRRHAHAQSQVTVPFNATAVGLEFHELHKDTIAVDEDGVLRTSGNCHDKFGDACDLCCDGKCCDEVDTTAAHARALSAEVSGTQQLWVPIRFVLLSKSGRGVTASAVASELRTYNQHYNSLGIWFYMDSFVVVKDATLADSCRPGADGGVSTEFQTTTTTKIKGDNTKVINVYICYDRRYMPAGQVAQFPWDASETDKKHFVLIHQLSFNRASRSTGVHELGHWLGLYHTFQGGCKGKGDGVDDTPAERGGKQWPCNSVQDSCPALPGKDDTDNHMGYGKCRRGFTAGQKARMMDMFKRYKRSLYANTLVDGSCPSSATQLSQCRCTNSGKSPLTLCKGGSGPNPTPKPAPGPTPKPTSKPAPSPTPSSGTGACVGKSSTFNNWCKSMSAWGTCPSSHCKVSGGSGGSPVPPSPPKPTPKPWSAPSPTPKPASTPSGGTKKCTAKGWPATDSWCQSGCNVGICQNNCNCN